MNILGIDTATQFMGVACIKDTNMICVSANHGYRHGETLMPWIQKILGELDLKARELDLIVCSTGPGSFTGLRIGCAAAKGIATGTGCPLVGVPVPDVFGYALKSHPGTVYPVIDARKNRFYTAAYKNGTRISDYLDREPLELLKTALRRKNTLFTGPDVEVFLKKLEAVRGKKRLPCILPLKMDLSLLIELGRKRFETCGDESETLVPLYIRKSEAELALENKST